MILNRAENNWHNLSLEETFKSLATSKAGLSSSEARQRLSEYGFNELGNEHKISVWMLLLEQFKNLLVIILLVAVILSAILGETTDAIVIFIIVLFAAGLGFIQEYRAEKAIQSLKRMAAPLASVVRDGVEIEIPAREVVPGDIIVIRTGDRIPADSRIIDNYNLRTDEAVLTGESIAAEKTSSVIEGDAGLGDRLNILFAGTAAVYGRCRAVVIGTGQETEFGKIATMLKDVKQEKTPLQVNLDRMGKWIAIGALSLCAILVLLRLFEEFQLHGETLDVQKSIVDMLIWGVSLAVAAVPEALPAVVTISMALGVNRMVKRHALIRKLPAVETLGCTTIICSDKTGTMTQDQMTLKKIYTSGKLVDITGTGYEPQGDFLIDGKVLKADANDDLHRLLVAANLCSDTTLFNSDGQWKIKGDPTEGAFVVAAVKAGIDIERVCSRNPRIGEVPFSSETKRMTAIYHEPRGIVAYSNGAAEVIVNSCKYVYVSGREIELDENERNKIHSVIQNMASDALRVLGTAYKHLPDNFVMDESASTGMVLLGLGGMIDPPRPEVRESIETCVNAGIRTVMITGDHKVTAVAIARELGILKDGLAVTGSELNGMSQVDFENKVGSIEVYARVSPEHKLRVVEALAVKGHVVAMTGDGINDAPALKKADIGIAMGIKGTDVTKESAEMILTDDNFASIVSAVEEGRAIFGNIKKYLVYLLSCNIGEILLMALAILFGPLLGLPGGVVPLIAIQILYVNLATDGLPALALSVDPHSKDIMNEKPRPRNQNIFSGPVLNYMLLAGLITCIVPLGVFIWALDNGKQMVEAQCLCFVTLILIQFVNAFSCRSLEKSMFNLGVKSNKWLLAAIAWEICLLAAIIYIPALREPFNTYPLDVQDWLIAVTGAGTLVIAAEIYKAAYRSSPIK